MAEPFLGEIRLFAGNFAPLGWAHCDGELLPIDSNAALFSLLGTTYGGDGLNTFALPDLRGRVPVHATTERPAGSVGGAEQVTLTSAQLPPHRHVLSCSHDKARTDLGVSGLLGVSDRNVYGPPPCTTPMADTMMVPAGGGQAHPNLPPCLVVNFIIALEGIYPSFD